ncbi:Two-component system regulatory protein [gamma proteobacterium IMCC2047]|nr:Two-component system regulatory protein [gamma proteobacterium IMCC2047]
MRALIVEDEPQLQQQLADTLCAKGYSLDRAGDGEEGLYYGNEFNYDIAIIDLGLPKLDGIELIRQLRANDRSMPVLILTARDNWQDKVEGLEAGADDYLAKPFHMEELLARLNALIRRAAGKADSTIKIGYLQLDIRTQQVLAREQQVSLTAYEYKVLEYLMLNPQKVISKTELTEHIYAQDYDRDSNVIEVFIGRLRKKLDPDNLHNPIETLRGRGYRLTLSDRSS